jgi:hypothetical protein
MSTTKVATLDHNPSNLRLIHCITHNLTSEATDLLLTRTAHPDYQDLPHHWSPLMYAISHKNTAILNTLLEQQGNASI